MSEPFARELEAIFGSAASPAGSTPATVGVATAMMHIRDAVEAADQDLATASQTAVVQRARLELAGALEACRGAEQLIRDLAERIHGHGPAPTCECENAAHEGEGMCAGGALVVCRTIFGTYRVCASCHEAHPIPNEYLA